MIVFGKNVLAQLAKDPKEIKEIYIQNGLKDENTARILRSLPSYIQLKTVSKKELDKMCANGVHQGIGAKVKDIETVSLQDLVEQAFEKTKTPLLVALDSLQDPHNVGAILRTVDACGAQGVILCRHKGAGLTAAAVKTSTGAAYTVPVCEVSSLSSALKTLKEDGFWIMGTDFDDESIDYRKADANRPIVLIIGNEGKGMSQGVKKQCDYKLHLPMKGSVQSLNASVAAGILLYDLQSRRGSL
jgi:23S rRNA (guanosine2251-2'-O)-methyltransferase